MIKTLKKFMWADICFTKNKKVNKYITRVLKIFLALILVSSPMARADSILESFGSFILNGIISYFLLIPIVLAIGLLIIFRGILSLIGGTIARDGTTIGVLTPEDIIYNRIAITNIDFFDFSTDGSAAMATIRNSVAQWFVILNGIALIALLCVLIFLAIRIIISAPAQKAIYKTALQDWVFSVAMLFAIQIYIVAIIKLNNSFVSMLESTLGEQRLFSWSYQFEGGLDIIHYIITQGAIKALAFVIMMGMVIRYTFTFLFQYIARMFKVMFLIIVSPLITVTYSLDKVGDRKAQAMQKWNSQFLSTILIQPFHCLIYTMLFQLAHPLITGDTFLVGSIVGILAFKFMSEAESLIKEIFGLSKASSMSESDSIARAVVGTEMLKRVSDSEFLKKGQEKIKEIRNTTPQFGKTQPTTGAVINQDAETIIETGDVNAVTNINIDSKNVENITEYNSTDVYYDDLNTLSDTEETDEETEPKVTRIIDTETPVDELVPGAILSDEKKKILKHVPKEESDEDAKERLYRKFGGRTGALVGAALEAADSKDPLTTNLIQGGYVGHSAGGIAAGFLNSKINKRQKKETQTQNYHKNVTDKVNETAKSTQLIASLKGIELDNTTKEGQAMIAEMIEKIESHSEDGKLLEAFNKAKDKLTKKYIDESRDSNNNPTITAYEARLKVDNLTNNVFNQGTDFNVKELTDTESDYLVSLLEHKILEDKAELDRDTSEITDEAWLDVKAIMLNGGLIDEDVDISSEKQLIESDIKTFDEEGYLRAQYIANVEQKDDEIYNAINEIDKLRISYDQKYNSGEEELDKQVDALNGDMQAFIDKHDVDLKKIETAISKLEKKFEDKYRLGENVRVRDKLFSVQAIDATEYIRDKTGDSSYSPQNKIANLDILPSPIDDYEEAENTENTDNTEDSESSGDTDDSGDV